VLQRAVKVIKWDWMSVKCRVTSGSR